MFDVQKHSGHVEGLSHYRLTKAYPTGIFWSVSLFTAQSLEALTKGRWTPFVWWEVAMMHAIISPPGLLKAAANRPQCRFLLNNISDRPFVLQFLSIFGHFFWGVTRRPLCDWLVA